MTNLDKYDTRKASDEGRFLHLEFNGKKLYADDVEGKPAIGLRVLGSNSTEFRRREKDLQRGKQNIRIKKGGRISGMDDVADAQRKLYAAMVAEYIHIGEPFDHTPTVEKTLDLFERFAWIEDQVVDFVEDEANFLGER